MPDLKNLTNAVTDMLAKAKLTPEDPMTVDLAIILISTHLLARRCNLKEMHDVMLRIMHNCVVANASLRAEMDERVAAKATKH